MLSPCPTNCTSLPIKLLIVSLALYYALLDTHYLSLHFIQSRDVPCLLLFTTQYLFNNNSNNNHYHLFEYTYITLVLHPITKTQQNKIQVLAKQNNTCKKSKVSSVDFCTGKYIVLRIKRCFLVQSTKLSLPDIALKSKILQ